GPRRRLHHAAGEPHASGAGEFGSRDLRRRTRAARTAPGGATGAGSAARRCVVTSRPAGGRDAGVAVRVARARARDRTRPTDCARDRRGATEVRAGRPGAGRDEGKRVSAASPLPPSPFLAVHRPVSTSLPGSAPPS